MAGPRAAQRGVLSRRRLAPVLCLSMGALMTFMASLPAASAGPIEAVPVGWGDALNLTLPSDSGDTPLRVQIMVTNAGNEPVRLGQAWFYIFQWMGGTVPLEQPGEVLLEPVTLEPGERFQLETFILIPEAARGNYDAFFHFTCRERVAENNWTGECGAQFGSWRLHIDRAAPTMAKEWAWMSVLSLSALTVGAVYALWRASRPRP